MTTPFCCHIAVKSVSSHNMISATDGLLACSQRNEGAPGRTRTCDMRLRRPPFCPLNYGGGFGEQGGVVA